MFETHRPRTRTQGALDLAELIFHAAVRQVRKGHGNAILGLILSILQSVLFVVVFYVMFTLLGLGGMRIRGDFFLYIMSGVFLFMVHTKTVGAVAGAEGPTSPMMKHAPMNTIVSIGAAALSTLYMQVLAGGITIYAYHVAVTPITIDNPVGAVAMVLLAWFTGVGVGLCFMAAKPWAPDLVGLVTLIYQRMNMIASGKMFVANMTPGYILAYFDWNPLFHAIDQARGFVFLNYQPHFSSWQYAFWVGVVLLMIGLMGEFYTRKHASASWYAKR
jgi:ABC-type polysaccharide/polyol phosphate export permease